MSLLLWGKPQSLLVVGQLEVVTCLNLVPIWWWCLIICRSKTLLSRMVVFYKSVVLSIQSLESGLDLKVEFSWRYGVKNGKHQSCWNRSTWPIRIPQPVQCYFSWFSCKIGKFGKLQISPNFFVFFWSSVWGGKIFCRTQWWWGQIHMRRRRRCPPCWLRARFLWVLEKIQG